jgi:hypothetical protein
MEDGNYKRMFEAACGALGEIDELLGIDPDSSNPEATIAAVKALTQKTAVAWISKSGSITKGQKIAERRMKLHPNLGYQPLVVAEIKAVKRHKH